MQKEFPIKTTIQKGTVYEKLHHHHLFELSHCYVFISFYIIDNRIITNFNQKKLWTLIYYDKLKRSLARRK